jgi:hypothetical protein
VPVTAAAIPVLGTPTNSDGHPGSTVRGGASDEEEDESLRNVAPPSPPDSVAQQEAIPDNNVVNHQRPPWAMGSLFQLHNELKAQTDMSEEEESRSPHNKGRGGALATLTMEKKPASPTQTTTSNKPPKMLWGAFDTSSVAPLSSRLLKDEEKVAASSSSSTIDTTTAAAGAAAHHNNNLRSERNTPVDGEIDSVRENGNEANSLPHPSINPSIWWNSVWQQQFPPDDGPLAKENGPERLRDDPQGPLPDVSPSVTKHSIDASNTAPMRNPENKAIDEPVDIVQPARAESRQKEQRAASSQSSTMAGSNDQGDSAQVDQTDVDILPIPKEVQSEEMILLPPPSSKPPAQRLYQPVSPYESSGYWASIDNVMSAGFAVSHPSLRVSRHLRVVRKQAASVTGMHGLLSGKPRARVRKDFLEEEDEKHMGLIRRRLAAIDRARGKLMMRSEGQGRGATTGRRVGTAEEGQVPGSSDLDAEKRLLLEQLRREGAEAEARHTRVQEIDRLISEGQQRLMQLVTEKDILQKRPNPLWNYTTSLEDLEKTWNKASSNTTVRSDSNPPSREFKFPPPDLVDEYLTMLVSSGRLVKLNHTELWRNAADEEDEADDDDWLSPKKDDSIDALSSPDRRRKRSINGGSGSRWLRNGLGEKLGETVETAAYRAVGGGVMSFLARMISSLHGINVMQHTDIRLFAEQSPDLPPSAGFIPGTAGGASYAQGAFENILRKGTKKTKKRRKRRDESFIQRDAVVETLLSQCQIAAPLLKIFPLAWQRAMLGNIVTLVTATMMDFFEGLEFEILGHRLSFTFVPITEEDMMRHWAAAASDVFSRRHKNVARFEAAVQATARDVAENLNFLDKWHERVLGGDALKTQVSHLVARLVLTLVDETLSGARMDMWTTHAGGPRLMAGLEYRAEGMID